jgi:hypothetical protein
VIEQSEPSLGAAHRPDVCSSSSLVDFSQTKNRASIQFRTRLSKIDNAGMVSRFAR